LSSSRYVPWQKIRSWICLRCGGCCRRFRIVITPREYALLSRFAEGLACMDNTGNLILRKVGGRCVAQDRYGLCALQHLGMKPVACKAWPFTVFSHPKLRNPEALFVHGGQEYSVYVDRAYPCIGMNRGNPEVLPLVIEEVIEIYERGYTAQFLSTSNFASSSLLYDSTREHLAPGRRSLGLEPYGTGSPRGHGCVDEMIEACCRPVRFDIRLHVEEEVPIANHFSMLSAEARTLDTFSLLRNRYLGWTATS